MKLFSINRKFSTFVDQIPTIFEGFDDQFYDLLLEGQEDFLANKYPEVSKDLIDQAIALDKKNAEKIIFGLKQGIINKVDTDSLELVKNIDPYAKTKSKSESELAYDTAIKDAKRINPRYWVWILKVKKNNPDAQFDEGIFHYLEAHDLTAENIKDESLEDITRKSQQWHNQEFAEQQVGGTYKLGPDSPDVLLTVGQYAWVPVTSEDARIEGAKMQNCIGKFCNPGPTTKIFSLRNKFNNPHISLSIKNKGSYWVFGEIKGKQNRIPIPKYVQYIMPAVDELVRKGVKIEPYGDLTYLPEFSVIKYIDYMTGDVLAISHIVSQLSDEKLNELIQKNGISNKAAKDESIIKRLKPEVILGVFTNPKQENDFDYSSWLMAAITERKITREQAIELINKYDLRRSAQMVLLSAYRPSEFMEQIKKVHLEDLVAAMANYKDPISAYPLKDSYFLEVLKAHLTNKGYDPYRVDDSIVGILISKLPFDDIIKTLSDTNYGSQLMRVQRAAIRSLTPYIINMDVDSKIMFLSRLPKNLEHDDENIGTIVYSIPFENLRDVYALGIDALNEKIKPILLAAGIIKDEFIQYRKMSGTSATMMADADLVLHTNDEDELRKIRKATKSRGVKILVDRKLARLQRLQDVK